MQPGDILGAVAGSVSLHLQLVLLALAVAALPATVLLYHRRLRPSRPSPSALKACRLALVTLLILALFHGVAAVIGGDGGTDLLATIISLAGALCLALCLRALVRGSAEPYLRGFDRTYDRGTEPVRYWLSLGWNTLFGLFALVIALGLTIEDQAIASDEPCFDYDTKRPPLDTEVACTHLLARTGVSAHSRGLAHHFRSVAREGLGNFRGAEEDYRAAISAYGEALSDDPNNPSLYLNSATVFHRIGAFKPAREALDAYITLEPEDGDGFLQRGLVNLDDGRLSDAVQDFTRSSERLPGEAWPLVNRGIAHAHLRNAAAARADLDAGRKLDPGNIGLLRGEALLALQAGDEEGALALLTEAVQKDSSDRWSAKRRNEILHRRDREAEAAGL